MSVLTRPPHRNDFIPRWTLELLFTVMPDVSTALKKTMKNGFNFESHKRANANRLTFGGGGVLSWTPSNAASTMGLNY